MSPSPSRRELLRATLAVGAVATATSRTAVAAGASPVLDAGSAAFPFEEATVKSLQEAMAAGTLTARALTAAYLDRLGKLDQKGPMLRTFIELNPTALADADALDQERKEKGPRGPLHGIPVGLKDNIETVGPMQTTAGSLALEGVPTLGDSAVVARLRAAGAVILGKTNLAEWANIRSESPTNGWSARGGLTRNPYALDRTPSGSSSGSAVAVSSNLCALALGTETDGSVTHPASFCGIVGIKPTVGLVSRTGIIPISVSQDTAGPMARSVEDAAVLLTVMAGADPADPSTTVKARPKPIDYAAGLSVDALKGARLGVVRSALGHNQRIPKILETALEALKTAGAVVVDGLKLPKPDETEVMKYEFKAGLNAYLAKRRPESKVKTLKDLIAFNEAHAEEELRWFGQDFLVQCEAVGPLTSPAYKAARAKNLAEARTKGIDALLAKHKLDALVTITADGATLIDLIDGDNYTGSYGPVYAAVAGYPSITVPCGADHGLPVGLLFFSRAWAEQKIIGYAYAFEQATRARRVPQFLATVSPR